MLSFSIYFYLLSYTFDFYCFEVDYFYYFLGVVYFYCSAFLGDLFLEFKFIVLLLFF